MIERKIQAVRYDKAIVGFGGEPTFWWMRFLKKGFYHCLIALGDGQSWILIDPLVAQIDLIVVARADMDLFLNKNGYRTVHVRVKNPKSRHLRLRPYSCVETVKRFLGIENPFLWTPYQLYLFLKNRKIILDKVSKL